MPNPKHEILESFSFTCSASEGEKIYALLKLNGYAENSEGLKKFLIDFHDGEETLEPEETEDRVSKAIRFGLETIAQNPEIANALKRKGSDLAASLLKKMK